jgi:hypothetical protein
MAQSVTHLLSICTLKLGQFNVIHVRIGLAIDSTCKKILTDLEESGLKSWQLKSGVLYYKQVQASAGV